MSTKQYDALVFIGRFQPLHKGHVEVIKKANELADKVIVLVGSANQPRTIKNPFTFAERAKMLADGIPEVISMVAVPLHDFKSDNNVWAANVQRLVEQEVVSMGWTDKPRRIGIIGHAKDESSFYLKLFPQWDLIDHCINEVVHATDIRKLYFEANLKYLEAVVPHETYKFLEKFKATGEYKLLVEENTHINQYKKSWEAAPYAPIFVTVDCVLIQSGHILLVKRKASPGKGLWALPGGFVNQTERLEDAMIRELREETLIKVPSPVLRGSIKGFKVFDAPDRSLRGRTITHAYHIELLAGELPPVKGNDDALKAKWIPLSHVREEELFEDHWGIISSFMNLN